jgi:antitoxin Phd
MKQWKLQDAKARFSECVDRCLKEGPQMITRRGTPTAVLVPLAEWEHLQKSRKYKTLKEWLLAPTPKFEDGIPLPDRRGWKHRPPPTFDD